MVAGVGGGVGPEGPQKSGLLVESAQIVVLIQSHCVFDIIRFVRNEKMIDDGKKILTFAATFAYTPGNPVSAQPDCIVL